MALSFSIREYTTSMRSSDVDKCWPFDPKEKDRSLPSMDVRKFRWWAHELDRKVKQKSPKKRSISELFAMAPQIATVEARSDGPEKDHQQKLTTSDLAATETPSDEVEKKGKSKGKKRKIGSETIMAVETKSDGPEGKQQMEEETIKERKKKKKKKLKKKNMLEVPIHHKPKDNACELEPSKLDTFSGTTKGDLEVGTQSHSTNAGTDEGKLTEEPDEALIPLISILKKCKRNKNHAKKGKGVTFSGVDAILGANDDTTACTVDPPVLLDEKEDKDTCPKYAIDLNEALPEPIDLNCCLEDHYMEPYHSTITSTGTPGSLETAICHSSLGNSSLLLNLPQKMHLPITDLNKNQEHVMNLNSDISGISMSAYACTEQPSMVPCTVRLMGKDVTVNSIDLKAVSTCSKAQDTASSSHASCSYYSDGANNNNNTDKNNCLEMNFGTRQFTSGNCMPAHYVTANPGPVISIPVVPSFNFYHPQFPVVSPPMISFPLGGSVFPQPYSLNFSGFGDGNYTRDKSYRNMASVEKVNVGFHKDKDA